MPAACAEPMLRVQDNGHSHGINGDERVLIDERTHAPADVLPCLLPALSLCCACRTMATPMASMGTACPQQAAAVSLAMAQVLPCQLSQLRLQYHEPVCGVCCQFVAICATQLL